ncbi:MAG TPA: mannitol dehydrogenase family protein [Solirubrobacteraceae bacterium]|nr:mannitol dehydrogenase family protein [Solirubrobacteraceae bacterium]
MSRIVHLGLGAFHRAHQAVYTVDAGGDWEICGVAWRSRAVVDALRASGGRYRLVERGPIEDREREIGVITETLVAQEEPDAVIERIAAPDTRVVTLTITEGGYDGPMIELLARGLAGRGDEPIAVLPCDNVPDNGVVARRAVGGGGATFASTVVDRITPASDDPLTVVTEPFSLWIIERFDGDRPAWERAGALIVDDARPYELMKLRLVNASHSALAHLGIPRGHETVADAIGDPELRDFVERLIAEELRPTLQPVPEIDLDAFVDQMFERFANPRIHHRLQQIATGAQHKIPLRLLAPARELRAAGREPVLIERVVAAAGVS